MTSHASILPKRFDAAKHRAVVLSLKPDPKRASAPEMPSARIYQSAGEIVGRRDLSDDVLLKAIAERMVFERRDPKQARTVLNAALVGKQIAVNFVRSLALPMPSAPLEMPVQALLDDKPEKPAGRRRLLSFNW